MLGRKNSVSDSFNIFMLALYLDSDKEGSIFFWNGGTYLRYIQRHRTEHSNNIQGVSGGILNILGSCNMDYSE